MNYKSSTCESSSCYSKIGHGEPEGSNSRRILCREVPLAGGRTLINNSSDNGRASKAASGVFVFGAKGAIGSQMSSGTRHNSIASSRRTTSRFEELEQQREEDYASTSRRNSNSGSSSSASNHSDHSILNSRESDSFIEEIERSRQAAQRRLVGRKTNTMQQRRPYKSSSSSSTEDEFASQSRLPDTSSSTYDRTERESKLALLRLRNRRQFSTPRSEIIHQMEYTKTNEKIGLVRQRPTEKRSFATNRVPRWTFSTKVNKPDDDGQGGQYDENDDYKQRAGNDGVEEEEGEEKGASSDEEMIYRNDAMSSRKSKLALDPPNAVAPSKSKKIPNGCCDKCDSKTHETESCPYFKKSRDKHADAQRRKPMNICGDGKIVYIRDARIVQMPGDGSCLFHSLAHGLGPGSNTNARRLRREIADFIAKNPLLEIAETPLKDWVQYDSNSSVASYARRMAVGGWGGGIECAACSRLKRVNVHVYEKTRGSMWSRGSTTQYKRISCFDLPGPEKKLAKTINVIYCGGVHYNALEIRSPDS